jgi:hypothetical protein
MWKLALTAAIAISGAIAEDLPPELPSLRRVFVDRLVGNESADRIRELLVASLHNSKLFVITEDVERADAILRGAADEQIFTEQFQSSDGVDMRAGIGAGTRSVKTTGLSARSIAVGVGDNEAVNIHERKHEAMATVRLVSREGDVIWSTTQESEGGKFRGAGADVVEKVTKRLIEDMTKAKGAPADPPR